MTVTFVQKVRGGYIEITFDSGKVQTISPAILCYIRMTGREERLDRRAEDYVRHMNQTNES